MVNELFLTSQTGETCIAFYFCQHDDVTSLRSDFILRSLLRQSIQLKRFSDHQEEQLSAFLEKGSLAEEDIVNLFVEFLTPYRLRWFVLDGLDECLPSERKITMKALSQVASRLTPTKIFLSSRPEIERDITWFFPIHEQRSMNSLEVHADIKTYIDLAVEERLHDGDLVVGNATLIPLIKELLGKESHGM